MKKSIQDWLAGKKTYLVGATAFILAGLQAIGVQVDPWVFAMLGSIGLYTLRQGVSKV